jgi:hypothetical protein
VRQASLSGIRLSIIIHFDLYIDRNEGLVFVFIHPAASLPGAGLLRLRANFRSHSLGGTDE